MATILDYLRQAGFTGDNLRTAWAVQMAESGGNPQAFNPRGRDLSYGLFQINMLGALGPDRRQRFGLQRNEDLYDPATNARVAFQMSGGGANWQPWTTFTSGKYKQYLSQFPDAAKGGKMASAAAQAWQASPAAPVAMVNQAAALAARQRAALGQLQQAGGGIYGSQPGTPNLLMEAALYSVQRRLASVQSAPTTPVVPAAAKQAAGLSNTAAQGYINTAAGWAPTHVTDGLDWNAGQKTAGDIMADPGTLVGAPEDGVVIRRGSAQGGEALYFRGASGTTYWLGHIDSTVPVGKKVQQGGYLARVSADHPRPHLHIDKKL